MWSFLGCTTSNIYHYTQLENESPEVTRDDCEDLIQAEV